MPCTLYPAPPPQQVERVRAQHAPEAEHQSVVSNLQARLQLSEEHLHMCTCMHIYHTHTYTIHIRQARLQLSEERCLRGEVLVSKLRAYIASGAQG